VAPSQLSIPRHPVRTAVPVAERLGRVGASIELQHAGLTDAVYWIDASLSCFPQHLGNTASPDSARGELLVYGYAVATMTRRGSTHILSRSEIGGTRVIKTVLHTLKSPPVTAVGRQRTSTNETEIETTVGNRSRRSTGFFSVLGNRWHATFRQEGLSRGYIAGQSVWADTSAGSRRLGLQPSASTRRPTRQIRVTALLVAKKQY
jgi:hypothetical protein